MIFSQRQYAMLLRPAENGQEQTTRIVFSKVEFTNKVNRRMDLNPPWTEFDRIPWGSIGWRMGLGEAHWSKWCSAFSELAGIQKAEYQLHWPEPEGWKGFYDFIEHGTLPPHVVEREARVKAAARVPSADEHEIVDSDQVQWMIKHYLEKPKSYVAAIDSGPCALS